MKISYIITHRSTHHTRDDNLLTILKWLSIVPGEKEIILIEQDNSQKLKNLSSNIKYIFAYNPNLFSKAWGMNIGIRNSSCEVLAFLDSDCLFKINEINMFFDIFTNSDNNYDIGAPNTHQYIRLTEKQSIQIRNNIMELNSIFKEPSYKGTVLTGGLFYARRKAMDDIKWWDEDFLGWGGEDSAVASKLGKMKKSVLRLNYTGYHLWHDNSNSLTYYKRKKYNENLWKKRYCGHQSKANFDAYIKSVNIDDLGNINKYAIK